MAVRNGDTVVAHYVGTLEDGTEFDRSPADAPLTFQQGSGQLIEGFDNAVLGREKGDKVSVNLPPAKAYGEHDSGLVFQVPVSQVPDHVHPQLGQLLHVTTDQGELEVAVSAIDAEHITLDANHPLAGKTLNFDITIVDIK